MCAIDTCCGLHCRGCSFAQSHGCGGCIATGGRPFHGDDPPGARLEQCRRWAAETTPQEVTLP